MLVKCKHNNSDQLSEIDRKHISDFIRIDRNEVYLEIEAIFIVYGISFRNTHPWYYVYEEPADPFPKARPHQYFNILDHQFDPSWRLTTEVHDHGGASCKIVPEEWANDPLFYENLVDDDPQAMKIMQSIKDRFEKRGV